MRELGTRVAQEMEVLAGARDAGVTAGTSTPIIMYYLR